MFDRAILLKQQKPQQRNQNKRHTTDKAITVKDLYPTTSSVENVIALSLNLRFMLVCILL